MMPSESRSALTCESVPVSAEITTTIRSARRSHSARAKAIAARLYAVPVQAVATVIGRRPGTSRRAPQVGLRQGDVLAVDTLLGQEESVETEAVRPTTD